MTFNTFGHLFRFTTFGESHGEAIGCVVDGVPSLIPLSEADIQPYLDKRKPAQSKFTTQRKESDTVKILSGVFEGKTTGAPIALIIYNEDQKSKDYDDIKDKFRPGHADYTYFAKYGIRDYRGGGRSSARETAMRVAAGAIARKILSTLSHRERGGASQGEGVYTHCPHPNPFPEGEGINIVGYMVQMGEKKIDRANVDLQEIGNNPFWCPDAKAAAEWEGYLDDLRKSGSSTGAVIEVVADNVPVGLGAPIYKKLDADLAAAMMSINAVKGVEIGDGFAAAGLRGEENADCMRSQGAGIRGRGPENNSLNSDLRTLYPQFLSNHAGGILGGISSGQQIVVRFAVKPTSSILTPVDTIDVHGNNTTIQTKGRHDPCVGIRAVPVGEAMMACVLADHLLMHRALKPWTY